MPRRADDDFDLESAFNDDSDIDALFGDKTAAPPKEPVRAPAVPSRAREAAPPSFVEAADTAPPKVTTPHRGADFQLGDDASLDEHRRTSKDFELNMDAILLTAQSSMIMEGIKCYSNKDFSPATHPIYLEALKGIDLYIKIIDRNPNNYSKLKTIIDTDIDCQRVENTVFNLFKKVFHRLPDDNAEKIVAFEKFRLLFENALNKATISTSSKMIKKYYLISGGIDEKKIAQLIESRDKEIMSDMTALTGHIQIATEMVNKGNFEIVKGLRGKDLNAYIINATILLAHYYGATGNAQVSAHYQRIHNNFKKYFITK
ncbi:MAG: hypothetical protein KBA61_14595 [Spirochaetes bacterium]|nr:hypothetical protein [Spirochaetota bacterium]HPA71069.1 hypothetical protein [Spirochaetota bacterium]